MVSGSRSHRFNGDKSDSNNSQAANGRGQGRVCGELLRRATFFVIDIVSGKASPKIASNNRTKVKCFDQG